MPQALPADVLPVSLAVRIRGRGRSEGGAVLRGLSPDAMLLELRDPLYAGAAPGAAFEVGIAGCWSEVTLEGLREQDSTRLEGRWIRFSERPRTAFMAALAVELLAGGASVADLKRLGVRVPLLSRDVIIRRAAPDEYPQIFHLRTLAYQADGKFSGAGVFSDEYDARAIQLCAFFRGRPVAALRLMVLRPEEVWEQSRFFGWPDSFPARADVVEISRVSVHPDFRRCRLLEPLFRRCAAEVLLSGRGWLLGSATPKLLPLYEQIGCKPTDVRILHSDFGELEHTVFLADVRSGLLGAANPLVWLVLWRGVAVPMLQDGLIAPKGAFARLRLAALRLIGRVMDWVEQRT